MQSGSAGPVGTQPTTCRSRVSTRSDEQGDDALDGHRRRGGQLVPERLDHDPVPVEQDDLLGVARDRQQIGLNLRPEPPVLGAVQVAPLELLAELLHAGPEALTLLESLVSGVGEASRRRNSAATASMAAEGRTAVMSPATTSRSPPGWDAALVALTDLPALGRVRPVPPALGPDPDHAWDADLVRVDEAHVCPSPGRGFT